MRSAVKEDADRKYASAEGIEARFAIRKTQLARMRQANSGPPFVRVSYRKVLYKVSDVEAWLQALPGGGAIS
ncbi:hypothetical protein [Alloacidobacterium sp.]|uniref:helix-turn-helix transcriptional regulator n=1 Tax=Alloacidobacterium sp. TaxID=2951999 RepID=UPI002D4B71EA|nr:hypothetical protein [Alloacidobacterium sp.]HYK36868.1 hypothetical protein [Alloacidobacterium sp.]